MNGLPEGWVQAKLSAVSSARMGKTILSKELVASGLPVFSASIGSKPWGYIDDRSTVFHRGTLVISARGTIGEVKLPDHDEFVSTQTTIALQPFGAVLPSFLRSQLSVFDWPSVTATTAIPMLTIGKIDEIDVALPPLAEQRRIVAKLDALTACTARARADLDRIPALAARYKQSVLARAFRGELLGLKAHEQQTGLDERCWPLPNSWNWVPFSHAATVASNLTAPADIPDLPHIAPDNVEARTGRLLHYRTIAEDKVISPKHRFRPGQIIYSKIRPYLRKAVFVDFEGACSADMYPLDPAPDVHPQFLLLWLISEDFAAFTVDHEGRTVLPKINQAGLNKTPFPLPPLTVQAEIATKVWSAFAEIDRLTAEAAAAHRLLDRLDQAILAKAFRGELVPQDPADEPASVLLERIRAERAAAPKPKRGRTVRAAA